ncbi:MAG: hypothetical protein NC078_11125, partial [Ruminococcus sp.]|nr:hypothetical protein [Ruminococcus sp.]
SFSGLKDCADGQRTAGRFYMLSGFPRLADVFPADGIAVSAGGFKFSCFLPLASCLYPLM